MQNISTNPSSPLSLLLLLTSLQLSVPGLLQRGRQGGSLPPQYLNLSAFWVNQNDFSLLILGFRIPAAAVQLFSAFLVPALSPHLGSTCHVLCFHQDGPITFAPICGLHISFWLFGGFQKI